MGESDNSNGVEMMGNVCNTALLRILTPGTFRVNGRFLIALCTEMDFKKENAESINPAPKCEL